MNHDFLPVHLIQTFVAFVESANITEAAGKIGLSQPAVSVHLKKFEEMLPQPIFEMQGKRKTLTWYGEELYRTLSPSFHQIYKQLDIFKLRSPVEGIPTIKIGGENRHLNKVATLIDYPGPKEFISMSEELATEAIECEQIDVAILQNIHSLQNLEIQTVFQNRYQICAHRDLAKTEMFWKDLGWLKRTPFILNAEEDLAQRKALESFLEPDQKLNIAFSFGEWLPIVRLIKNAKGFSVLPEKTFYFEDSVFTHVLPMKDEPLYSVVKKEIQFLKIG